MAELNGSGGTALKGSRVTAVRPTSAVEKSRAAREGGTLIRPASAGVWRGKPSVYVTNAAKVLGTTSESETSRSSASESSQKIPRRPSRSSSTASSNYSKGSKIRKGGDDGKKDANVWMIGPLAGSKDPMSSDKSLDDAGDDEGVMRNERLDKLKKVPGSRERSKLQQLENALQNAAVSNGKGSGKYLDACDRLGRYYNSVAMQYLQAGEHSLALDLLQSAESLIAQGAPDGDLDKLKGLTYNNLGCYFRREGMPMEALKWLLQAHDIESRVGESSSRSSTFLNLCAVYSLLGKHLDALKCATEALKHLQITLREDPDSSMAAAVPGMEKVDNGSMLAIAYHNIAVEQEYLNRYEEAVQSYKKALQVAESQCGSKSPLAAKIRIALTAAANAVEENIISEQSSAQSITKTTERAVIEEPSRARPKRPADSSHRRRAEAKESDRQPTRYSAQERDDMTVESFSDSGSVKKDKETDKQIKAPEEPPRKEGHQSAGAFKGKDEVEGSSRRPSGGTGVAKPTLQKENSWGSEKSPGSGSSRDRAKRPLSAARLPSNDESTSSEQPARVQKRHSRKTARPRTAGRERMKDQEREELLAMTDPSSSDAGEYEVVDDVEVDDDQSQAAEPPSTAWQQLDPPHNSGNHHEQGSTISSPNLANGRPLSAARPPQRQANNFDRRGSSRKTARPRTAGRHRLRETDREDLLVLSSGSDGEAGYEFLSDDEEEHVRGGQNNGMERKGARPHSSGSRQDRRKVSDGRERTESVCSNISQSTAMDSSATGPKRPSNRPLSAGVSFNSPSNATHHIRPQSAPAVRVNNQKVPVAMVEEEDTLDIEDEDSVLIEDTSSNHRVDQAKFVRPSDTKGKIRQPEVRESNRHMPLPQLLRESDDDADEEELDTKGILLQQTEVLTAELEKAKQRERELQQRLQRLEEKPKASRRMEEPVELAAPRFEIEPDAKSTFARKPAFGLPEAGLDLPPDTVPVRPRDKLDARARPPRPTNNARMRAKASNEGNLDELAEIRELTASLKIAAQHNVDGKSPLNRSPLTRNSHGDPEYSPHVPSANVASTAADPGRPPSVSSDSSSKGAGKLRPLPASRRRHRGRDAVVEVSAASLIQHAWFCHLARMRIRSARHRHRVGAHAGAGKKRTQSAQYQLQNAAVIRLQRVWRGHAARVQVRRYYDWDLVQQAKDLAARKKKSGVGEASSMIGLAGKGYNAEKGENGSQISLNSQNPRGQAFSEDGDTASERSSATRGSRRGRRQNSNRILANGSTGGDDQLEGLLQDLGL